MSVGPGTELQPSTSKYHLKPHNICYLSVREGSPVCGGLCEKGGITVVHLCAAVGAKSFVSLHDPVSR
jgi:hypothetical protein